MTALAEKHQISSAPLDLKSLIRIIEDKIKIELSPQSEAAVIKCREYLDKKLQTANQPIYGINTGFGSLYDRNIAPQELEKLQSNLVLSHACGLGDEIPSELVRIMLFLKVQSLAYGHSGIQLKTIQRLIDYYNDGVSPVVFEYGSLGASGDLAPLAHLSLPLIGHGYVNFQGKRIPAEKLNKTKGWEPIALQPKEGLALLNGTQFMGAYGVWCIGKSLRILEVANLIGALSLDVFDGRLDPFDERVHLLRSHNGQSIVAARFRELLDGSSLITRPKDHVQDPYSFRCIPQVHGASLDVIHFGQSIFTKEINGVTDNPNIFPDDDDIISSGNFHGQPLAMALDFLCIAMAEIGNISERRTFQLISGSRNLPNYLVANPGINSGLMIPQYTAASLVSKNKELCVPSSADSITSSNGQEDHVSMGANAALKAYSVIRNVYNILAIEWMTACQALEFRRPSTTSDFLEEVVSNYRLQVPFVENDRLLHDDLVTTEEFLKQLELDTEG